MSLDILQWSPWVIGLALVVSLGAGVVRGFAGFGYAGLTVAGLALLVTPSTVVPAVLAVEVIASLSLARSGGGGDTDKVWLGHLVWGNLIWLPLGLLLLASMPLASLALMVSLTLLLAAVSMRICSHWRMARSTGLMRAAGLACGLLNGLTASGGLAAAMLMTASGIPTRALRSTMVILLLFAGTYGLLCASLIPAQTGQALLHAQTWQWVMLLTPTMLIGVRLGRHWYEAGAHRDHRNAVLTLLILISGIAVVRGLLQVLQAS